MKDKATTKPFYNSTIPSDWEVKSLGELCNVFVGKDLIMKNNLQPWKKHYIQTYCFSKTVVE